MLSLKLLSSEKSRLVTGASTNTVSNDGHQTRSISMLGMTALHVASATGNRGVVDVLLQSSTSLLPSSTGLSAPSATRAASSPPTSSSSSAAAAATATAATQSSSPHHGPTPSSSSNVSLAHVQLHEAHFSSAGGTSARSSAITADHQQQPSLSITPASAAAAQADDASLSITGLLSLTTITSGSIHHRTSSMAPRRCNVHALDASGRCC